MRTRLTTTTVVAALMMAACSSGSSATSGTGVSATSIRLGVVIADFGSVPGVGGSDDPAAVSTRQWNVFIDEVNSKGGIHGRKLEPSFVKVNPLDTNAIRAACIELTQTKHVFMVFGNGLLANGDADLCVTAQNHTLDFTDNPLPTETHNEAHGLLITSAPTGQRAFETWARASNALVRLQGHKLGLLISSGQGERLAKEGLMPALQSLGYRIAYTAVVSDDAAQGPAQVKTQVQQMHAAGVDTVFMASAYYNLSAFVSQAVSQAWHPQYLLTSFEGNDIASLLNGMPQAFDGALAITAYLQPVVSSSANEPATYRDCRERWNAATGQSVTPADYVKNAHNEQGIAGVCRRVAFFAAAAEAAGKDLTRSGFTAAVQRLGSSVALDGLAGSFGPSKLDYRDVFQPVVWGAPDSRNPSANCTTDGRRCYNNAGPAFQATG